MSATVRLAAVAAVALLAACTGGAPRDADEPASPVPTLEAPVAVGEPAPDAAVDPAMLPYSYLDVPAVAPGWSRAPQEADGVFVAPGVPDGAGAVPIIAVDSAGTVLWRAAGPQETHIDLTRAGDRYLAVLNAPDADGSWVANAFDLRTGAAVWGPSPLPGTPTDPGLTVETASGLAALDAATGAVAELPDGRSVVAERDGTVVGAGADGLQGVRDGSAVWTTALPDLDLPEGAAPAAVPGARSPRGTVVVGDGSEGAPVTGTLVDVADGTAVATDVHDARADAVLEQWIALGERTLSAHDGDSPVWSRPVPAGAELESVGGVLAYLRVDDAVLVVNTATGADAQAYDPPGPAGLAVPAVIGADGAAALRTEDWLLLTTSAG